MIITVGKAVARLPTGGIRAMSSRHGYSSVTPCRLAQIVNYLGMSSQPRRKGFLYVQG